MGLHFLAPSLFASKRPLVRNNANSSISGGATTSHSLTCVAGSNKTVFLLVYGMGNVGLPTISACSFNGVAATVATSLTFHTNLRVAIYYVVNPPNTGSYTASVTIATSVWAVGLFSVEYANTTLASPIGNLASASGTSTAPSHTFTSAIGKEVLGFVGVDNSNPSSSVGAGQTSLGNISVDAYTRAQASCEPGDASVVHSYTLGVSQKWAVVGGSVQ